MKYTLFQLFLVLTLVSANVYQPGDNYSTFTPSGTLLSGATTDFSTKFGIAVRPYISSISLTSLTAQGNIITQIGDGQIQAATGTIRSIPIVTQIGDGQIQAQTFKPTLSIVTQIGDGQVQALPTTLSTRYISKESSFSSDESTTTFTITPVDTVIQTVTTPTLSTLPAEVVTVTDNALKKRDVELTLPETCSTSTALTLTLANGILIDSEERIGSIVSNRQFQFDGPPQAGAIYTAGWSIIEGKLALGDQTAFWQCLSGNFYNLYDENIAEQCTMVELDIIVLVEC
ncbi:hypothetical protein DAMA08_026960 [Martiniozyma asiatica (nom. inval.)]|nr:hypothetical protein DAMA08_026960 [Martiniozyma asiatica]